jgi:hypothetical protein
MCNMYKRIAKKVSNWLAFAGMSAEEAYLAQSSDIFELESRMKNIVHNTWRLRSY